jgi:hypothetical protein
MALRQQRNASANPLPKRSLGETPDFPERSAPDPALPSPLEGEPGDDERDTAQEHEGVPAAETSALHIEQI